MLWIGAAVYPSGTYGSLMHFGEVARYLTPLSVTKQRHDAPVGSVNRRVSVVDVSGAEAAYCFTADGR